MTAYIPALRKYLEGGGVVLRTDMSYGPMCDWLKVMDQDFDFSYEDVHKALGARSQLDTTQQTPMLKAPNDIAGFSYWAHYPHWGKKWTVLLRTQAGTALMLGATVGRGALIVTTTFALDTPALQNAYALAGQLKNGLTVYPQPCHLLAGCRATSSSRTCRTLRRPCGWRSRQAGAARRVHSGPLPCSSPHTRHEPCRWRSRCPAEGTSQSTYR
jgi:hypothetical protein